MKDTCQAQQNIKPKFLNHLNGKSIKLKAKT